MDARPGAPAGLEPRARTGPAPGVQGAAPPPRHRGGALLLRGGQVVGLNLHRILLARVAVLAQQQVSVRASGLRGDGKGSRAGMMETACRCHRVPAGGRAAQGLPGWPPFENTELFQVPFKMTVFRGIVGFLCALEFTELQDLT